MIAKVTVWIAIFVVLVSIVPVEAQQPTKAIPRIGLIFSTGTAESPSPLFNALRQGLRDLGYVEGTNISIERRYAEGRLDRMHIFVQEFVDQKIDVIICANTVVTRAANITTQ